MTAVEETYYVYAAGLGGAKLLELNVNGEKAKGYVYGGGTLIAKQEIYPSVNSGGVRWQHQNPGSASWVETAGNRAFERREMDALGQEVGAHAPLIPTYGHLHGDTPMFVDGGDPFHLSDGCGDIDGMPASCSEISEQRLGNGTAMYDLEQWGRRSDGKGGFENFVTRHQPTAAEFRSAFNTLDATWEPDYNDSTQDYTDGEGALVGVIAGRFVNTGGRRLTTFSYTSGPVDAGRHGAERQGRV